MQKKTTWIVGSAIGLALILGGAGVGWAVSNGVNADGDLTGNTLDQARVVALAAVGEGTVSNAEHSDDLDHAYAIEVTRPDGSEVDVLLDEAFAVVRIENDTRPTSQSSASSAPSSSPSAAPSTSPGNSSAPGNFDNLSEDEMTRASAAALAAVGSGTVFDIERSDDRDHAYEVTIILANGEDVDVELDAQFNVTKMDR